MPSQRVEQAAQTGLPQLTQIATAGSSGWLRQRAAAAVGGLGMRWVRSSGRVVVVVVVIVAVMPGWPMVSSFYRTRARRAVWYDREVHALQEPPAGRGAAGPLCALRRGFLSELHRRDRRQPVLRGLQGRDPRRPALGPAGDRSGAGLDRPALRGDLPGRPDRRPAH